MIRPILVIGGLLAAVAAAGAVFVTGHPAPSDPMALSESGIGPLRVGDDFSRAERLAFRVAPETAFSGIGCAGLDEIRYDGQLGSHPVGIMAMADQGRIQEIEATLYSPVQVDSKDDCRALRDRFAEPFVERFGPFEDSWEISKPVSRELLARTGPVTVLARWFATGGSCYVSAHYGVNNGDSVRLESSLATALNDSTRPDSR
ncbi:MAG: hypothetical protein EA419_11940 [Wenzhouxiangella sp.]|nr:MAG: hypothetical protein EA419_11940 [Wenzhouxiangella sp.]